MCCPEPPSVALGAWARNSPPGYRTGQNGTVKLAQVIKERRTAMGLSQAELGALVGTDARQIRRYEAGDVQPSLAGARHLAKALNITLDELVGDGQLDLSGEWWSAWQGLETDTVLQRVLLVHRGRKAEINTPPAAPDVTHRQPWHGELTIVEGGALGWYVLQDKHRGVLTLTISNDHLLCHWMTAKGLRFGPSGFIALARTSDQAQNLVETERQHSRSRWESID